MVSVRVSSGWISFCAEIALPAAAALPVQVWDAQLLPANANRGNMPSEAGGNFGVGGRAQQCIFLRRPGATAGEADPAAKPAATVGDCSNCQAEPGGQFSVS